MMQVAMFFGRRKEKDLSELRNQQIETLKARVPVARRVNQVSIFSL